MTYLNKMLHYNDKYSIRLKQFHMQAARLRSLPFQVDINFFKLLNLVVFLICSGNVFHIWVKLNLQLFLPYLSVLTFGTRNMLEYLQLYCVSFRIINLDRYGGLHLRLF